MKKRVFVLLTVIFIISSTIGCGEKMIRATFPSRQLVHDQLKVSLQST